jgi:hypothetical protein
MAADPIGAYNSGSHLGGHQHPAMYREVREATVDPSGEQMPSEKLILFRHRLTPLCLTADRPCVRSAADPKPARGQALFC